MTEAITDAPLRILVVLMGAIGDVVRGLSVVNVLKERYPHAHITWLVEPACSGIVSLHAGVDEVLVFNRPAKLKGVFEIYRDLSRRSFDVTLDMQRHGKSGLFSWLSGSRRRIGFHPKDSKEGNWLFNNEHIEQRGDGGSKIDHYLLFARKLGASIPSRIDGGLSHITLENIAEEWRGLRSLPYVGVILGSSRYSKDWPEEGYAGLLERLSLPGIGAAVLLGDRSKSEMAERLLSVSSPVRIINTVGRTSLRDLVGIIHGARVCVGPDSGPAHIAGAVGVPHVTLFGPTRTARNAPRGSESLAVVSSIGCAPCRRRVCPGLDKMCMRLITPEQVVNRMAEAL